MSYIIDQTIEKNILQLTGWDEQRYTQFIYDCGLAYLQHVIGSEYEAISTSIRSNEIFWNWWKINWEMRDKEFIEMSEDVRDYNDFDAVYLNMNDPRTLAKAIYLNGQVLQSSYAGMIQDLHQQAHYSKMKTV